jgi:5'-nucleotidase
MKVLISNDDGIEAPGIRVLTDLVRELADVWVVAPDREQSAKSHALTMNTPLRAPEVRKGEWAVSGTPADCIYLAMESLLPSDPDLILSGINSGANLGHDVFYSGTVAAALEGALRNVPAIAFSLDGDSSSEVWHWETAIAVARHVITKLIGNGGFDFQLLNVNIPNVPLQELRGLKLSQLGLRQYEPLVIRREDPRKVAYYWIGGTRGTGRELAGSDAAAIRDGWASITPMSPDLSAMSQITSAPEWLNGLTGLLD